MVELMSSSPCLELFAAAARRTPSRAALRSAGRTVGYAELDRRSDALAARMAVLAPGPGAVFGVRSHDRADYVVALLAALKSGNVYLPLDPDAPGARIAGILADSGAVPLPAGAFDAEPGAPEPGISPRSEPQDVAYVIYTSGTTGAPKGVAVGRSALDRHIAAARARFGITAQDVVLQFSAPYVDVWVEQVLTALTSGACLAIPEGRVSTPPDLAAFIEREGVTVANLPAGYWQEFTALLTHYRDEIAGLRLMISGSDTLPAASAARWLDETGTPLLNAYGPTEAVITSLVHDVRPEDTSRSVPIGRAIGARDLYVLDEALEPVAAGVPGELCIGGDALALGYLNRAGLTAQRFVPDPFSDAAGARMYRTGDVVRRPAGGVIEFAGRRDDQVKIRGYRIELGEIEHALAGHPLVATCAVSVYEPIPGDRRLAAYFTSVGDDVPDLETLRSHLRAAVPEYMVPAAYIPLPALPLSTNGKVDRKALPAPAAAPTAQDTQNDAAPATDLERLIAQVWSEVLNVDGIGLDDNFFHLGGDSLTALRAAGRMMETEYAAVSHVTVFEAATIRELAAAMIEADAGARDGAASQASSSADLRRSGLTTVPLSGLQRGLWILAQLDPDSTAYNIPWIFDLDGPVDHAALQQALDGVVARHETLRTTFAAEHGEPCQRIRPDLSVPVVLTDLRTLPAAERDAAAAEAIEQDAGARFSLRKGPLFRVRLIRRDERTSTIAAVFHHIVWDETSLAVFERELAELYAAALAGRAPRLPELKVQYADYAVWQQAASQDRQLAFWKKQLDGAPEVTALPLDRPRSQEVAPYGDSHRFELPRETARRIRTLARRSQATPFTVLLAAFAALIHRRTRAADLVVGTPVTTRNRRELDDLIGCFVNVIPLRLRVDADTPFRRLIEHVRDTSFDAYAHQDVPLDSIVNAVLDDRRDDVSPLFQTVFELHPGDNRAVRLGEASGTRHIHPHEVAKFELAWMIEDPGSTLKGWIEFDARLFDRATVAGLCREWIELLARLAAEPDLAIGEPVVPAAEAAEAGDAPIAETVPALFEERVRRDPRALALTQVGAGDWSYGRLNARANQIAHCLRGRGVGVGDSVGLHVPRSADCVASMLGVLKTGAAYVPLEPAVPSERLARYVRDAAPVLVVSTRPEAAARFGVPVLDLAAPEIATRPDTNPDVRISPDDIVYVPYTSGSTGEPKGTLVPHRAIPGFFRGAEYAYWGPGAMAVMHSALSWDGHVLDLYPALLSGGAVLIPDLEDADPISTAQAVAAHGASVLWLSAAAFGAVVTADAGLLKNVRHLLVGGDRIPTDHFRGVLDRCPETSLVHGYGPSEATVFATTHQVGSEDLERATIPIGTPVGDRIVYVLDGRLRPCPDGEAGELCISGPSLGHGYLNRPELTARSFIPDPFAAEPGARMYRTGDLVRRLPDGALEFVGRRDGQIKIRGYRVELGEIENVLAGHPDVGTCAVTVCEPSPGDKRLAAYLTARAETVPDPAAVQRYLRGILPEHMVPAGFTVLPALPLTPNGKVDRSALPEPAATAGAAARGADHVPPATDLERLIARVWSEVLGVSGIGVHDSFFQLGGDSLRAVRAALVLAEALDAEVPPRMIFAGKTVAALAARLG
jgi:amino acid adenylation domain-containing protein